MKTKAFHCKGPQPSDNNTCRMSHLYPANRVEMKSETSSGTEVLRSWSSTGSLQDGLETLVNTNTRSPFRLIRNVLCAASEVVEMFEFVLLTGLLLLLLLLLPDV